MHINYYNENHPIFGTLINVQVQVNVQVICQYGYLTRHFILTKASFYGLKWQIG